MTESLHRTTRLVAAAALLAVSGVGHGLHAWFGIEHDHACGCGHSCAVTPTSRDRGVGPDWKAEASVEEQDDCLLCQLLRSFRLRSQPRYTVALAPASALGKTLTPVRVLARDAIRRPPARGPPIGGSA